MRRGLAGKERRWAEEAQSPARDVGESQGQKPLRGWGPPSLTDALLIALIKANIWGNQGSLGGGCHS